MKNLKKLSVVFMIATLFSASFTSCIDNEVSPVVEAIYEAQADLIAAQAAVQNAEAALLLAQADAQQAQAALLLAQAEAAAAIAEGELAIMLAEAGLTEAQAQLILAQAASLESLTAAQVAQILAEASLTEAQAALVLAEAQALTDLTAAEVAQMLADAGYTEAQTARILAEIERYQAESAYLAAQREQELRVLIANTDLEVAAAQNALAIAQANFELEMAAIMAQIEEAGVQLAMDYAYKYRDAMNWANMLMSQLLDKQAELATAELLLKSPGKTWETFLAEKAAEIEGLETLLAERNATQAEVEALIANGGDENTQFLQSLIDERDELQASIIPIQQERSAIRLTIDELYTQWFANNDVIDLYNTASGNFDYYEGLRDGLVADNAALALNIADWQLALDDYDTALAALEADVTAAEEELALLETALADARTIRDAAQVDLTTKQGLLTTANTALTTLQGEINGLYASLVAATTAYTAAQTTYDAGLPGVTLALSTAQTNYDNAVTWLGTSDDPTLGTAWGDYNVWKANYEANPAGYTWFDDNTAGTVFAGGILGLQDDDNIADMSYVEILTWTETSPGFWAPTTYGTPVAAIPADVADDPLTVADETVDNREWLQTYGTATTAQLQTEVFWVEVGFDDTAVSNEQLLDDAIAALGDDNIFDTPPALPLTWTSMSDVTTLYTTDMGAYADLYNRELDLLHAQFVFDNYENDLLAAQAEYERLRDIYENQLSLLDAAQQVVVDAQGAVDAAQVVYDAAQADFIAARQARNNQRDVVLPAAEQAVADFLLTTEEDLMEWIANAEATIANNDLYIAEYEIFMAAYQEDMDALQADYDALMMTPERAAAFTEIENLWNEYFALGNDVSVIEGRINILQSRIWIYQSWYDVPSVADLQNTLNAWIMQSAADAAYIESLKTMLASQEVNFEAAQNHLALLQAQIDTILERHANTLAIAAKYKALMEAALAS